MSILVRNGTAFIDDAFVRADVRIRDERITALGALSPEPGEDVRDCSGLYVLPGFVDIHIHAYGGADCMRGE